MGFEPTMLGVKNVWQGSKIGIKMLEIKSAKLTLNQINANYDLR